MELVIDLHPYRKDLKMKEQFKLDVSKPCRENWNSFTKTEKGGFCSNCQKEVVDFTQFTDQQLISYFKEQEGNTCGKFRPNQLKNYHPLKPMVSPKMGFNQFKIALAACALLLISKPALSLSNKTSSVAQLSTQNQSSEITHKEEINEPITISGTVMADNREELPGVTVMLKGTEISTTTDINGRFLFPKKLVKGDVLIFSFIGMERKEYKIKDESEKSLSIVLEMDAMILGEVSISYNANGKAPKPTIYQRIASWF